MDVVHNTYKYMYYVRYGDAGNEWAISENMKTAVVDDLEVVSVTALMCFVEQLISRRCDLLT